MKVKKEEGKMEKNRKRYEMGKTRKTYLIWSIYVR